MDDLEGVLAGLLHLADGHAAAVVGVHEAAVRLDRDVDLRGVAGHRLVDRVVDDFPDEVMQAAGIGRADIHPGPAADGLETLEDLDAVGGIVTLTRLHHVGRADPPRCFRRRHDRVHHARPHLGVHRAPPASRSTRRARSSASK